MSTSGPASAYVQVSDFGRSVNVMLSPSEGTYYDWSGLTAVTTAAETIPEEYAALSLSNEEARALYEALSYHFAGISAVAASQLRKDYEAERARSDKLITAVIEHLR